MIVIEKIERLGLAYRKAKVDLYYSTNVNLELIADYEDDLHKNLTELFSLINNDDEEWVKSKEFVGSWMFVPKTVEMPSDKLGQADYAADPEQVDDFAVQIIGQALEGVTPEHSI